MAKITSLATIVAPVIVVVLVAIGSSAWTFAQLNAQVAKKLRRLAYDQSPSLVGAKSRVNLPLPWSAAAEPARRKKARK